MCRSFHVFANCMQPNNVGTYRNMHTTCKNTYIVCTLDAYTCQRKHLYTWNFIHKYRIFFHKYACSEEIICQNIPQISSWNYHSLAQFTSDALPIRLCSAPCPFGTLALSRLIHLQTHHWGIMPLHASEKSQSNDSLGRKNHHIRFLTNLIFRRNYRRRAALFEGEQHCWIP